MDCNQHKRFIYFIQAGGPTGPIKIGLAIDPKARLKQLQTGSPETLDLLGAVVGTEIMERGFHCHLSQHRVRGEWFAPVDAVLACIPRQHDALAEPLSQDEAKRSFNEAMQRVRLRTRLAGIR